MDSIPVGLDRDSIPIDEIREAQDRLYTKGGVVKTPLVPLNMHIPGKEIFLKLENFQPVRSFKIRGAGNALHSLNAQELRDGVYTSSAGNFAQGLAYNARALGVKCTVIVPDSCPETKLRAIEDLGGVVKKVSYSEWWEVMMTHRYDGMEGRFIHPVCEGTVVAGNGSIGLEILDDLPDVDVIICPYGGGGNICGIGSVIKSLKPDTKIFACEVETAAPLSESFAAGHPVTVANHKSSFVDGMGGKAIFPAMWRLARNLIERSCVLSLREICNAVKLLVERNCIVAEGAGAAPVAAALRNDVPDGKIVCVVSGGNIDAGTLSTILQGNIPT